MNKKHGIASEQTVILKKLDLCDVLYEAICNIISYYELSKQPNNDWFVLLIANFDCYFGNINFSKKWLSKIPDSMLTREVSNGVCRGK